MLIAISHGQTINVLLQELLSLKSFKFGMGFRLRISLAATCLLFNTHSRLNSAARGSLRVALFDTF